MNLHMDMINQLHLRASKQLENILQKAISFDRRYGLLSSYSPFRSSLERKIDYAKKIANGLLEQVYAKTPATYQDFERYRNRVRFTVAYYQLWVELMYARHDMLCAPKNGLKYPFLISSFDDNLYKTKEVEAIEHPEIVDREIKAFRDRLHEGFLTYGIDNARKCEERMATIRALPYPI